MRIRVVAIGSCAVVALAACSSSSSTPGSGTTGSSGTVSAASFCQHFRAVATKLSGLSNDVSDPTQLGNKLGPVVTQLQQLQNGAPSQVAPALRDLVSAMQGAAQAGNGGNMQQIEKQLQNLVPKLTKDFTTMETYVSKNCH